MLSGEESINDGERDALLQTSSSPPGGRKASITRKLLKAAGAATCIALIVTTWAVMAEKLQDLGNTYHQLFFQTYWVHSSYAVLYVIWKIWLVFPGQWSCNNVGEGSITNFREIAISSGFLTFVIYCSSYLWYVSISRTSISANTAVYQSTSVVVFIMSIPLLREKVTVIKTLSVVLTITGVCLVSFFGSHEGSGGSGRRANISEVTMSIGEDEELLSSEDRVRTTPFGYVSLVVSMILYAAYETLFKKLATKPNDTAPIWNGLRVTGYVGVHTLLMYWPVLVIVHFMGVETFILPTRKQFYLLLAMTVLEIIFNGALLVCIALSSPLFTAVGSVLVLPTTVILDWILKGYVLPWQAFLGIGGILLGFFMLVLSEYWHVRRVHRSPVDASLVIKGDQVLRSTHQASINTDTANKLKSFLHEYLI